jgi:hypothetical protein
VPSSWPDGETSTRPPPRPPRAFRDVGRLFEALTRGAPWTRTYAPEALERTSRELHAVLCRPRRGGPRTTSATSLTTVDLRIIDDFALGPMSKEEGKDVSRLFLERTGQGSMVLTSNRDTWEWLAMFDDVLLAQSAVGRVKNTAFDSVMDGESCRPRPKPKLDAPSPTPNAPTPKEHVHPRSRRGPLDAGASRSTYRGVASLASPWPHDLAKWVAP